MQCFKTINHTAELQIMKSCEGMIAAETRAIYKKNVIGLKIRRRIIITDNKTLLEPGRKTILANHNTS